jgi:hypothetical protein
MRDAKIYRKLRQVQVNASYKGQREKRAKDAAEKAEQEKK